MDIFKQFFLASFRWGKRHTQTVLLFLGMIIAYGLRVNLSVAIVAMTDNSSANKQFIVSYVHIGAICEKSDQKRSFRVFSNDV